MGSARPRLKPLLAYWQKLLNLQHWYVVASYAGRDALDSLAENDYRPALRESRIRVLDPSDANGSIRPHDVEQALVHELLHLHFAPFFVRDSESPLQLSQEQAIDAIAWALVNARRGK